jgi:hypothetical protein
MARRSHACGCPSRQPRGGGSVDLPRNPPQREGDISISTGETGYLRSPTIQDDTAVWLNDLWAVCAEGGCAWRLTAGEGDTRGPRLSPDGSRTG